MNNIKKIRLEKKMTKGEFGEMFGVSRAYIYQIENSIRPISKKVAEKISQKLNIPIDEIYGAESIKTGKLLSSSLYNLVEYFIHKEIKLEDYGDDDEHILNFEYDKELLKLLSKLSN